MPAKMDWQRLLSVGVVAGSPAYPHNGMFDWDYEQIAFSAPFRRLQDKTQVFPVSDDAATRTRLTHSIEVSSIGRVLGKLAATKLSPTDLQFANDVGAVVSAASLMHDIGNPPFGHSGEAAIQRWASQNQLGAEGQGVCATFANDHQRNDLLSFEGNAQGLRIVLTAGCFSSAGPLLLSDATLGAMMKYPCASTHVPKGGGRISPHRRKYGYFASESEEVFSIAKRLGMIEYEQGGFYRHPLAYLVEAADDICCILVDLEDSVSRGLVSHNDAIALLEPLGGHAAKDKVHGDLGGLRNRAVWTLVNECRDVFVDNIEQILDGRFDQDLISASRLRDFCQNIRDTVRVSAYNDHRVLSVEAAGYQVIAGLLDIFVAALLTPDDSYHSKILKLLPHQSVFVAKSLGIDVERFESVDSYSRVLIATDFVSDMTERFAIGLYQNLSGIRVPR